MPGYAIHIAIAQEYIKKHPKEVINKEEFLKGTIAPDLESNKNKSHYGNWGNYKIDIYLDKFLKDTKIKIEEDYWKGYFLHIYVDKKFTNKYFKRECLEIKKKKDTFHHDYDILNKIIINEYGINKSKWPRSISEKMNCVPGKTQYLKYSKIKKMIKDISEIKIEKEIEKIKENINEYKN